MPNTHLLRPLSALLVALALGCSDRPRADEAITAASWTDSLRLAESDSVVLGQPGGFTVAPGRAVYVSDAAAGRIVAFSWDGTPIGIIGTRGRGPGELLAPGALEVAGDELVVLDNPTARLSRFRISDGTLLGAARMRGPSLDLRIDGPRVWTSTAISALGTSLAIWDHSSDSMRVAGKLPEPYTRFPRLQRAMAIGAIAVAPDGIWVGMQGTNSLERYALDSPNEPAITVAIPRRMRRGVPLDRPEELRREVSYEDEVGSLSLLMGIGALGDGRVATAHLDATVDPTTESIRAHSFLSVISAPDGTGCIDLALPLDSSAVPTLRFLGDELYALEQRDGAPPTGGTWLLRMNVAQLRCGVAGSGR